ncbi:MAG: response regulator transcription factor [Paracoccaceae bacterium]
MARHVLLVEDEPNIVEAIRFVLSRDGWTVSTQSDGREALTDVARVKPDVVILDVMLPGRTGFEILQDLRASPAHAGLPVLMLTARGQSRDRDMAVQQGASMFLTKPFSNAGLLEALNALVTR